MEGRKSSNFVSKHEIEQLCVQMEQMASFLRSEIKPLCCRSSRETEHMFDQLAGLRGDISKFRSRLSIHFLGSATDDDIPQNYGEEDYDGLLEGVSDLFRRDDDVEGSDGKGADQYGHQEVSVRAMDRPSEDADQLKKKKTAEEEDIKKMEKLQLVPYKYTPPKRSKYRYSKEEDTELTMSDKEKLNQDEVIYDLYCQDAKSWCHGNFYQITALSSMLFAHYTPRQIPFGIVTIQATLQIFAYKIVSCELSWPLHVYGVVAARDRVDGHRNILFQRSRDNAQLVTQDDPYLALSGPSRVISAMDPVEFEVELKLKCRTESRDIPLLKKRAHDSCAYSGLRAILFNNYLCKTKLYLEQLGYSVQATFLSVRVVQATFKYGGRVSCSSLAHEVMVADSHGGNVTIYDPPYRQVVLVDSRGKMPVDKTGVLDLARCVVSVPLVKWNEYSPQYEESLKVFIQAYSQSGDIAAEAHVKLRPKLSNTSRVECVIGNSCKVEITIVWSVMPRGQDYLLRGEYA
uniref:Uncharacterized protein n=1 Tax=Avena sativa TaxID=4498 RepID=A0ACD5TZK2_AVESA